MNIIFPDSVKKCVDLQTNGDLSLYTDMPEAFYLDDLLSRLQPERVLDLGCGVGRASVYFFKKYGWTDTKFYMADGDIADKRYKGIRENSGEFYNTKSATNEFCAANGLFNFIYLNLQNDNDPWRRSYFDIAYSFLSIGFHWPLDLYLSSLYYSVKQGGFLIFGIRSEPAKWILNQIEDINRFAFKIIDLKLLPRNTRKSILVLEVL